MKTVVVNSKEYILVDVKNESITKYVEEINNENGEFQYYEVLQNIAYFSNRYNKLVATEARDHSDGATGAMDLDSFGWIFHDELCADGAFEDGSTCTNWQASQILSDILAEEGRWFRKTTWFWATWLLGGGMARINGMY